MRNDLKIRRVKKGLSTHQLEKILEMPEGTLDSFEELYKVPSLIQAYKIASYYGVCVTDIWCNHFSFVEETRTTLKYRGEEL